MHPEHVFDQHAIGAIAALCTAAGLAWAAALRDLAIAQELLAGFGLGAIAGAAIAAVQRGRGREPDPAYIINVAGLGGATMAILIYAATELR